jgi:homogentisate 1,2-dioxygenase
MPYYRAVGEIPRKRHLRVPHPSGAGFLAEELMGTEGFSQESALLYHLHSPSALVEITTLDDPRARECCEPDRPLVPRHLRTGLVDAGGDAVLGRRALLGNEDVVLSWVAAREESPLYRNACGDELVYVHAGRATLESSFGALEVGEGDYVVVPTGTTHRWIPDGSRGADLYLVESRHGHITVPARYLGARGQLLEGAPFSERDLRGPGEPLVVDGDDPGVVVRNRGGLSLLRHAHHPFDVVGWDGCLYPYAFSIHDFEPIVGAIHQPPPVHQTFAGNGFVVCSFVPRPFDFFPGAIKVPYHHSNVDSDEVLFYASGDFMSRSGSGIGVGSISYHPAGFVHGPQPGSLEGAIDKERTEEVAVMVDTFRPLGVSAVGREISDEGYPRTWARR